MITQARFLGRWQRVDLGPKIQGILQRCGETGACTRVQVLGKERKWEIPLCEEASKGVHSQATCRKAAIPTASATNSPLRWSLPDPQK